ncbi:MAG: hypothetical protein ACYC2K_12485, partial [Gemmatimonadales bacterium]
MRFLLFSLAMLASAAPPKEATAQAVPVPALADTISLRLVDVDLRVAVQTLGRFLDKPLFVPSLPSVKITLETPAAVMRTAVLPLLRGILESHNLELYEDSNASMYRVRPTSQRAATRVAGRDPGVGQPQATDGTLELRLFVLRLRHARASDVSATVNALYGRADALGEIGGQPAATLAAGLRATRTSTSTPVQNAVAGVQSINAE